MVANRSAVEFNRRIAWIIQGTLAFLAGASFVGYLFVAPEGFRTPQALTALGALAVIGVSAIATKWRADFGMDVLVVGTAIVIWTYVLGRSSTMWIPTGGEMMLILATATLVVGWKVFAFVATGNVVVLTVWLLMNGEPSAAVTDAFAITIAGTAMLAAVSASRYWMAQDLAKRQSEAHRLEERLDQKSNFEQAARRLINTMEHEISTPLTVISAKGAMLEDENTREKIQRSVERAKGAVGLLKLSFEAELARQRIEPNGKFVHAVEMGLRKRVQDLDPAPPVDVNAFGTAFRVAAEGRGVAATEVLEDGLHVRFDKPLDYSRAHHLEDVAKMHGWDMSWATDSITLRWPTPSTQDAP